MSSTRIKQDSSINTTIQEYTCDNGIRCLRILLGESENCSLTSTSLLAKTSANT